ncbi:MAG: PAS domain S-box protein [Gammaproteobacteria bacterium]|nr:PAS domain S-box protein [Gammaproteobacteria bacterium]
MPETFTFNEKFLKNILNGMVDGVITINDKGIIQSFNKSAETIFGYSSEEAIGQNVKLLMPESTGSHHDDYINHYLATGDAHIIGINREVTAQRKNGEQFPMRLSVVEYPSEDEDERWFIGSCLDITLTKQKDEQLNRSMKMDALGKFISGVAHDYNNMLGVILGYSEIITDKYKDDPQLQKYISQITHAALRNKDLTTSLLSYSSSDSENKEKIIINDTLNSDYQILSKILTANIKLIMKLDENLWPAYLNKGCLEDAILNMTINAMHAMPEGGTLELITLNTHIRSLDAQILNIQPGDYIKLSISDTGIGMTAEVISHIFEHFYTTKGKQGTGLGLSQVYAFISQSNGTIHVQSDPGKSTCFSIYLPRYNSESHDTEMSDVALLEQELYQGTETILVVDDELSIVELTKTILSSHGYKVISANSGREALSILEKENIDLVLSDVIMPDMDGYELAHIIQHKFPHIKIQLCSGYSDIKGKSVTNTQLYKTILQKPFSSKVLLQRIKELLSTENKPANSENI